MNITNRTTHDVQQGTGPWLRLREGYCTASEAPAALGVSKYTTRAALLRKKHTTVDEEHPPATLAKFRSGHDAEALARPMSEANVGSELFPTTMSAEIDGLRLLASLDGQTLEGDIIWETKLWNEELAAAVRQGAHALPEHYTVQMDQELLVSGAEACLFTCTDGTPDRYVACWYKSSQARFVALVDGWRQFERDLAAYTLPPAVEAAPVGKAPETLPALRIEVTGQVTASNLAEFKATALDAIRSVNRTLTTDQDFADADKSIKWCADVESRLAAAKDHALSQTASIDALFKTIDDIAAEARRVRLDLDKLVTRRKGEVRDHAAMAARAALDAHIATLNAELAPFSIRPPLADFAGAIKGRRTMAGMQDALDGVLAVAKIASDEEARALRANLATFKAKAEGFEFLFADLGQILHWTDTQFEAVIFSRIAAHKLEEQAREMKRKAAAEAAEQRRLQAEESARQAAAAVSQAKEYTEGRDSQQVLKATAATPDATGREIPANVAQVGGPVGAGQAAAAAPVANEPATLTLGMICERLQFTVRADFLADVLHVKPAKVEGKRPGTYTESQFATICHQLQSHVSAMAELYDSAVAA